MVGRWVRWLIPLAGLLALAGYFGPWVEHRVAGLVITGLDLGEYVKFLPALRSGALTVWREGFYWPLMAISLNQSLYAFRPDLGYAWPVRAGMLALAGIAALNLLPPAWTPARLATPEFYLQSFSLFVALMALALSPLLALLPRLGVGVLSIVLCALAIWFPVQGFLQVLPAIAELYHHALRPGWGMMVTAAGLALLGLAAGVVGWTNRST